MTNRKSYIWTYRAEATGGAGRVRAPPLSLNKVMIFYLHGNLKPDCNSVNRLLYVTRDHLRVPDSKVSIGSRPSLASRFGHPHFMNCWFCPELSFDIMTFDMWQPCEVKSRLLLIGELINKPVSHEPLI